MKETKYYCDKCKKEIPEKRLIKVEIKFVSSDSNYAFCEKRKEICFECIINYGIEPKPIEKQQALKNDVTFEEKFFNLLAEYGITQETKND